MDSDAVRASARTPYDCTSTAWAKMLDFDFTAEVVEHHEVDLQHDLAPGGMYAHPAGPPSVRVA